MALLSLEESTALDNTCMFIGKKARDVREIFESLGVQAILNYSEGKSFVVPFLGEFKWTHTGDEVTEKGKTAIIKTDFTPSAFIVKNIGQVDDGKMTDAEKILINRFRSVFREDSKR